MEKTFGTILITGASGMLGRALVAVFLPKSECVVAVCRTRQPHFPEDVIFECGDLTDPDCVETLVDQYDPDFVIHSAALVNLSLCEEFPDSAMALHAEVPRRLVRSLRRGQLIYISTDSVFDGQKGGYSESDDCAPLNRYAATKLAGELATLENPDHLVLRTNLYGFHVPPNEQSLAEWLWHELSAGHAITGFTNVLFNPLYVEQLADLVSTCCEMKLSGVLHLGCHEGISKYEFACRFAEIGGVKPELVKMGQMDLSSVGMKRPTNTILNCQKQRELLGSLPDLNEGIRAWHRDFEKWIEEKEIR